MLQDYFVCGGVRLYIRYLVWFLTVLQHNTLIYCPLYTIYWAAYNDDDGDDDDDDDDDDNVFIEWHKQGYTPLMVVQLCFLNSHFVHDVE